MCAPTMKLLNLTETITMGFLIQNSDLNKLNFLICAKYQVLNHSNKEVVRIDQEVIPGDVVKEWEGGMGTEHCQQSL